MMCPDCPEGGKERGDISIGHRAHEWVALVFCGTTVTQIQTKTEMLGNTFTNEHAKLLPDIS